VFIVLKTDDDQETEVFGPYEIREVAMLAARRGAEKEIAELKEMGLFEQSHALYEWDGGFASGAVVFEIKTLGAL
jgi:hypothetical protein